MKNDGIVILGAGFSGLSSSYHLHNLDISSIIFEEKDYPYGRAKAFEKKGYVFDQGPHESFTKEPYIIDLFARSVNNEISTIIADVSNYWKGYWLRHPAQVNLHNLPTEIKVKVIESFIEWQKKPVKPLTNYKQWLDHQFGEYFAKNFPGKYTKKYWTVHPSKLTTDWVGNRMYPPAMKEVLFGAFEEQKKNLHYINSARYPLKGGYGEFGKILLEGADIQYNHKVESVNLQSKFMTVNGKKIHFERLISSVPLPEFIHLIEGAPQNVREAAIALSPAHLVIVTIGTKEKILVPYNWFYFYDESILFSRVHQPHLFSKFNAPENRYSLQMEIYFSKYRKHPGQNISQKVIDQLIRTKVISSLNDIEMVDEREILYGNIIFDKLREKAMSTILGYLKDFPVDLIGRYGEWQYYWSDQSVLSGKRIAEKIHNTK